MIEVKDVTKKYNDRLILEDLSLEIPKGKITSLIGPNGAGKSTLLSIISRLIRQDVGNVLIEHKDVLSYNARDLAKKISFLKQTNNLDIKLTVRELVAFGRFPYSQGKLTKKDNEKVDQAIEFLDLGEIKDSYIDELSGGQRQRAFLAMVVAQDTEYILLDEPLNNLDMKNAVRIMKTLKKLTEDLGKTIIIVIHDINFASFYSDYIATLKDGKIIHFNSTSNIICPKILNNVFDMDFNIVEVNGKKMCNYF